MKNNFLLILAATALVFSIFVLFSQRFNKSTLIDSIRQIEGIKSVNKQTVERKLDKKGCELTSDRSWCDYLKTCLQTWENCPETQNTKYQFSHSECANEGGSVRVSKCMAEEEKLGDIESEEENICCIQIRGRI
jgi:hypothetical protein